MNNVNAFRIGWKLGYPELIDVDGVLCIGYGSGSRCDLPVEFFSHQFMNLNPLNTDDLLQFAELYGPMQHPRRFGICVPFNGFSEQIIDSYEPELDGFSIDTYDPDAMHDALASSLAISAKIGPKWDEPYYLGVTLFEMRTAVIDLQYAIDSLFEYLHGDQDIWHGYETINAGACNDLAVNDGVRTFPDNNLTNAICNQIIATIADEHPWKTCACEGCERLFKRYQGKKAPKTSKNPSDAIYCCKACQDRQGQRNRRNRLKLMK